MGLLNFMKNVGNKFSGPVDGKTIEEKIKTELGSQIIEVKAEVKESEIVLSGLCENNDAREKAVLIAGNTNSIGSVNYFNFRVKEAEAKQAEPKTPSAPVQGAPVQAEAANQPSPAISPTVSAEQPTASQETEFYTIVSGDTLSKISKKYYGDANKYPIIFEANREVIKHPDKIYVGQTIRIPKRIP